MENIYKADYMQDPCDCLTKENLEWLEEHCEKAIRYERKEGRHEHQITLDLLYRFQEQQEIIANIKEYANNEIESATEDIADYIDDDREGNKDIIGELKEWREHWRDINRILNNKKTYIDYKNY